MIFLILELLVGWGRDGWGEVTWGRISKFTLFKLLGVAATASVGSLVPADVVWDLSGQEATTASVGSTTIKLDSTPALTGTITIL